MMKVKIKQPIWGAGTPKMFDWQKDGFGRMGVGVREDILHKYDRILVEFENAGKVKSVEVDCRLAREYSKMYGAFKYLTGGVKVLIFPVFAFRVNMEDKPANKMPTKEEEKEENVETFPQLTFQEKTALRKYFKGLTKEQAIEVGKKTSNEHWDNIKKGMGGGKPDMQALRKADQLAKKLNFWRELYKETYG